MDEIVVRGARQHNLKDIDVRLPRGKFVVITGPSGSGKSSLAFDTIYAEGQRRYVESLNAYARQFLERMPRPDVDSVEGLSPSIAVKQGGVSRSTRSTVGTATEIYDYLRLLYARVGEPHCTKCGKAIRAHTVQQVVDLVLSRGAGTRIAVRAPVVRALKGDFKDHLRALRKEGFVRIVADGELRDLGEDIELSPQETHDISVLVDRVVVSETARTRLTESIELAFRLADGLVEVVIADQPPELFSEKLRCIECDVALPEMAPSTFSFNSAMGACPRCAGVGEIRTLDPDSIVPDTALSIDEGAIAIWGDPQTPYYRTMVTALHKTLKTNVHLPWRKLPEKARTEILFGAKGEEAPRKRTKGRAFEGVIPGIERRLSEYDAARSASDVDEDLFARLSREAWRFMRMERCPMCRGTRLRPEALAVTVSGKNIAELCERDVTELTPLFAELTLSEMQARIAEPIAREIRSRLGFLEKVGLGYLSLDRSMATISGGEGERIRLATQIGSGLSGVLYVLDEPSAGLHPRDNAKLIDALFALRKLGNTVLVVEHDLDLVRASDLVVDMGPGAGKAGGKIIAMAPPSELDADEASITGPYLSGRASIGSIRRERSLSGEWLTVRDARLHTLKNVTARFPVGALTCVTGVSGSGKSSLVVDTLLSGVRALLRKTKSDDLAATLEGAEAFQSVIDVDQAPIGRTPHSNPASYVGLLAPLRELFASLPDAKARGYAPGRFSFNLKGGRCEACEGNGLVRVEMHFLPDVYVECETCRGDRYNRETLDVRYRGLSIAQVLRLSVDEAADLFHAIPKLSQRLAAMRSLGLGYLALGQSATTLSGGEAQRVKLARELARRGTGRTLYVLDEPTTGLHPSDIGVLIDALHSLVDQGHTVVIVEHNADVASSADWVIDMGPEGGHAGGRVLVEGRPEDVAKDAHSPTAPYLREALGRRNLPTNVKKT